MAAVAGHRTKGIRAFKVAGTDKENISPKKTKVQQKHKKTHDINGIFNFEQRMAEKLAERTHKVLSPKSAGVSKPLATKPGYFARMLEAERARASARKGASTPTVETFLEYAQRQRQNQQVMGFGLAETLKPYIESNTNTWTTKMQDQQKQLEAIRQGIDHKTGKPLNMPGIPSKEDFAILARELEHLNEPFENDQITLQFRNPDGSTFVRTLSIGELVDKFMRRREKQKATKKQYENGLKAIEQDIDELRQEISDDASAGKKAAKDSEKQMKVFEKEKKEIDALAQAERDELKEEEKRKTAALNAKIKELVTLTAN